MTEKTSKLPQYGTDAVSNITVTSFPSLLTHGKGNYENTQSQIKIPNIKASNFGMRQYLYYAQVLPIEQMRQPNDALLI